MDYYERAGLLPYLEKLGFHLVGFGCTTCIGNSGPLLPEISEAVERGRPGGGLGAVAATATSRAASTPTCRMNYLASPPLVVAYALAGTMDIDLLDEPLGHDPDGNPVYLRDLWPSQRRGGRADRPGRPVGHVPQELRRGLRRRRALERPGRADGARASPGTTPRPTSGGRPTSTACRATPEPVTDIHGARVLAVLGDSVTTDHISPAGVIKRDSPAGRYLIELGVAAKDFNSYGSRRGNHEVMVRGTFANIRLRNRLAPGTEGGVTLHLPDGEQMSIYDAAMRYQADGVPLVVLAGKEYGSGSSRDWAAKGTMLLGVRAVLAESYERIHRANLVGMGILPLEFPAGESVESLGLTGHETFEITGLEGAGADAFPREVAVRADDQELTCRVRIDTPNEVEYYRNGGILQYVLRQLRG